MRAASAELDRELGWLTVPELPLPTRLPSDALAAPRIRAVGAGSIPPLRQGRGSPQRLRSSTRSVNWRRRSPGGQGRRARPRPSTHACARRSDRGRALRSVGWRRGGRGQHKAGAPRGARWRPCSPHRPRSDTRSGEWDAAIPMRSIHGGMPGATRMNN